MDKPQVRRWFGRLVRPLAGVTVLAGIATAALTATAPAANAVDGIPGVDVSRYQGTINWTQVRGAGIQFAYIAATDGPSHTSDAFSRNYLGAYNAGVIRGAYHFARPDESSGVQQANHLADNGGAWSRDNLTLPAALDLEGGCYGMSQAAMRSWIAAFLNQYRARTTRYAVIYTTTSWWTSCTGNYTAFWANHPLWLARWASTPGTLPAGAPYYTFWQHTNSGTVPGISTAVDRDTFNGTRPRLVALANNTP
ncbi:GH25 family lysozyme [Planosporangium mesophilum]|uniref:lysozyme n=1 Tax=Planosporangium mesophilum TaxID=689768 RepID=A0A8J3X288_9ACTN|nr:GH25 family lysozyme [Planosporangium mesophilum]NJC82877.1 hydrolase [Planosporangium mesophilum]GII24651.1 hypothetical protein Pme01_42480 [Planosporangium mesophilum]